MRALLLLASATSPLMAFCVWSGLPGHADNNVFNLAELPPLPVETSQLPTPQPLNDRSLPTDDTNASDSLWFQLTRTISLSRLAEALDLAPRAARRIEWA